MNTMSQISNNNGRIAKNTIFLYLRMFIVLFVTLYTSRVVLNALGVEDYGVYNVVGGFVTMFAFINVSMANGIQRFYNFELGRGGDVGKVYSAAILIQCVLAVTILILTETFGLWYLNNMMVIPANRVIAANWIFQMSIASLVLVMLQVPFNAAIMAYERMDYYAYVSIIDVLLKLVIAFVIQILSSGDLLIVYGALTFGISVINFVLYYAYVKRNFLDLNFVTSIGKNDLKSITSFSAWNLFGTFAYIIKGQGLNLLLNSFFGATVNAARGISFQVLSALQSFSANIVTAFRPQLVQSYAQGDFKRTEMLMFTMSKITFYLLLLLSLPVLFEMDYILRLWLGDIVPEYTSKFTILIIVNMLILNFNTPLSQVVHASGKMRDYQIVTSVFITAILPVSYWVLIKGGNPSSVYWTSNIVVVLNQVACLFMLRRIFRFSIGKYLKEVVVPCCIVSILTLPSPLIIRSLVNESFVRLVILVLVTSICVLFFAYYFGCNNAEKDLVARYLQKITSKFHRNK